MKQMTELKEEKRQVSLYRRWRYVKDGEKHPALTFRFDINQDAETLKFSYAICHKDDNFCKGIGRDVADERMNSGDFIIMAYDREYSLLENAYGGIWEATEIISSILRRNSITKEETTHALKILSHELTTAFSYMTSISYRLQADNIRLDTFLRLITLGFYPKKESGNLRLPTPKWVKVFWKHQTIEMLR